MALKEDIQSNMRDALRAGQKERLGVIRMLLAAVKQREIDERVELDDAGVLQVVDKLIKQRREAATQFGDAGRQELAEQELAEIEVLKEYLPEPLSEAELAALIDDVIGATGAASIRDMSKVMKAIRERAQGRADMATVSRQVKARLSG
jgi:uncharacterized protein YqeY